MLSHCEAGKKRPILEKSCDFFIEENRLNTGLTAEWFKN